MTDTAAIPTAGPCTRNDGTGPCGEPGRLLPGTVHIFRCPEHDPGEDL
jgi:hypothetical protein